jgi:hypothetical protein
MRLKLFPTVILGGSLNQPPGKRHGKIREI